MGANQQAAKKAYYARLGTTYEENKALNAATGLSVNTGTTILQARQKASEMGLTIVQSTAGELKIQTAPYTGGLYNFLSRFSGSSPTNTTPNFLAKFSGSSPTNTTVNPISKFLNSTPTESKKIVYSGDGDSTTSTNLGGSQRVEDSWYYMFDDSLGNILPGGKPLGSFTGGLSLGMLAVLGLGALIILKK